MTRTMIHIDDEAGILRSTARNASGRRPDWRWQTFEPKEGLQPIVEAIRSAVTRGDKIVYMTDRQLGPPFGNGEDLWKLVWDALLPPEREAIDLVVMACTSNGFEPLRSGIMAVSGGSIQIVEAPKVFSIPALFALLPP